MSVKNKPAAKKARREERKARKAAFAERYGTMAKVVRKDHGKYLRAS